MAQTVSITVNDVAYERKVEPRLLLVHFLRDILGLTGTNIGCDTSQTLKVLWSGEVASTNQNFRVFLL